MAYRFDSGLGHHCSVPFFTGLFRFRKQRLTATSVDARHRRRSGGGFPFPFHVSRRAIPVCFLFAYFRFRRVTSVSAHPAGKAGTIKRTACRKPSGGLFLRNIRPPCPLRGTVRGNMQNSIPLPKGKNLVAHS